MVSLTLTPRLSFALPTGCLPKKCGRFVTDDVVTEDEAHELLELAKKGLSKGGSSGGASILDLHSGALSHGEQFVNLYKVHPELFRRQDFEVYVRVQEKVRSAVAAHFGLPEPSSLRLTHPTFFSRLTSRPPSTPHDEYWHLHVDKETYPAFHYTSLLYLTDHGVDFEGGEFVFVDGDDKLNRWDLQKKKNLSLSLSLSTEVSFTCLPVLFFFFFLYLPGPSSPA